ncbi:MAG: ABC transporter ATP-binding protein [Malacoplasma sp.]
MTFNYKNSTSIKDDTIVNVENLNISFKLKKGIVHAVRGVDLSIKKGQIVGIVGESGSGKSVTVKALMGFNGKCETKAKYLDFNDIDILSINKRNWKFLRGSRISYIPQDPLLSLNPTKKIGAQITETILITKKRKFQKQAFEINKNEQLSDEQKKEQIKAAKEIYKDSISKENLKKKIYEVLAFIGIKNIDSRINAYPHEFSGGMRQRIVIAMSIVSEPDLIIADEPTTALDVTIQAKVLDLIKKLRNEFNITIIFISHNIALIANFCDYIYVMYAGKIVEQGLIKEIFTKPRHPYTWGLICSIPDTESTQELESIPGTPPNLMIPPVGDAFAPRNKYALAIDFEKQPPLFSVSPTHKAATWLLHPDSPHKDIPKEVLNKIKLAKKSFDIKEKNLKENKNGK